jgi:hypothetical protein
MAYKDTVDWIRDVIRIVGAAALIYLASEAQAIRDETKRQSQEIIYIKEQLKKQDVINHDNTETDKRQDENFIELEGRTRRRNR